MVRSNSVSTSQRKTAKTTVEVRIKPKKMAAKKVKQVRTIMEPIQPDATETFDVQPFQLSPSVNRWTNTLMGWADQTQKYVTDAFENREELQRKAQEALKKAQDRMDLELGRAVRRSITRSPQRTARVAKAVGAAVKILMSEKPKD